MPNTQKHFDLSSFSLVFTTTRSVAADEQLFLCYCSIEQGVAGRAEELAPYGIAACKCSVCINASPERDLFRAEFNRRAQEHFRRGLEWQKDPNIVVTSAEFRELLDFQRIALEEGLDRTMFYAQFITAVIVVYRRLGLYKKANEIFSSMTETATLSGVNY